MHFTGKAEVQIGGRSIQQDGFEKVLEFSVEPDDEMVVTLISPPPEVGPSVSLYEVTPAGERLPAWESVSPFSPEPAPGGTSRKS
jgi:hypothetical protein